jgi:hypothetical protein
MSSYGKYSSSRSSSIKVVKKDLVGIEWKGSDVKEFSLLDTNTIYAPIVGAPLTTTFDVKKEDFEVAAYLDLAAVLTPVDSIAPTSFPGLDLPIAIDPSLFSEIDPDVLVLYDIVGSASAEGKATDIDNDGYAESFKTDEIEVYLGLINDSVDGDPVVGAVEIDIELKRNVDILLDGGQQSIDDILGYLQENGLLGLIEEIEIKYQYDSLDPLIAELGPISSAIADSIVAEYGSQLEGLIEIEQDDVNPSKWAVTAFNAMRPAVIA